MDFKSTLSCLKAAADPTRLRLLHICAQAELTVSDLMVILGQSQPRISRHLKVLSEAGLLERTPEGTHAFFKTVGDRWPAGDFVAALGGVIEDGDAVLSADRARLDQVRAARAEAAQRYFQANAEDWDTLRSLHVDEAEVEAAMVKAAAPSAADDYLDIGTGTGRLLEVIAPRVAAAEGIDLSRDMLAIARDRIDRAGLTNCRLRHGDLFHLPWPADRFDLVTIHQVLHYLDDPGAAIQAAARVLRPGGRLVIADFAPHGLEELRTEHAHRRLGLNADELRGWLLDAGLVPDSPVRLPGDALTVEIWTGHRAAAPTRALSGALS